MITAALLQSGSDVVQGFVIFAIVLWIYFLPTFRGWRKSNRGAIFALNLLLGWTLVGWVVAMVWALTKDAEPTKVIVQTTTAPTAYCSECGKPVEQRAHFCSSCGKPVNSAVSNALP